MSLVAVSWPLPGEVTWTDEALAGLVGQTTTISPGQGQPAGPAVVVAAERWVDHGEHGILLTLEVEEVGHAR